MGKFVVLPSHPSNDFFAQFPNCLPYATKEEFVGELGIQLFCRESVPKPFLLNTFNVVSHFVSGNLYYALTHSPKPLTEEYAYALSWNAATERLIAAGSISVREAEAMADDTFTPEGGVEVSSFRSCQYFHTSYLQ